MMSGGNIGCYPYWLFGPLVWVRGKMYADGRELEFWQWEARESFDRNIRQQKPRIRVPLPSPPEEPHA